MRHLIEMAITAALLAVLAYGCGSPESNSNMDVGGGNLDTTGEDIQVDSSSDDGVGEDGGPGVDTNLDDTVNEDTPGEDTTGEDTPGEDTTEDTEEPLTGYTQEFLEDICQSFCDVKQVCDLFGEEEGWDTCFQACLLGADDDNFVKYAGCVAMLWHSEEGEASCGSVGICENPLSPSECEDYCGGAANCGFMSGQLVEVFGATMDECMIQCGSFATLAPGGEFQELVDCALPAMESCNVMAVMDCILNETGEVCSELCGPEGKAEQCELYPAYWADMDACNETCEAWATGQVLAVQICVDMLLEDNFGGDEEEGPPCNEIAPDRCMDPPQELPEGALEFCEELFVLCEGEEDFEMFGVPELCGWFMVGFLAAAPPGVFHNDFLAAKECIQEMEQCDTEGFSWMGCFLDIYEPAMDACVKLVPCLEDIPLPPEDTITVEECALHLTLNHANNPEKIDPLIDCIEAAEGCPAILACMPPDPEV